MLLRASLRRIRHASDIERCHRGRSPVPQHNLSGTVRLLRGGMARPFAAIWAERLEARLRRRRQWKTIMEPLRAVQRTY